MLNFLYQESTCKYTASCSHVTVVLVWLHVKGTDRMSFMSTQLFLSCGGIFCFSLKHWKHWGMHTGVICDLDRSLVNMVLLQWSCQSALQSVSRFRERPVRGGEGAPLNSAKTSIPSSQSQPTELFKWCRISPETCRVELGEGGPNVTLATLRADLVNYHKSHDDLENCYWVL